MELRGILHDITIPLVMLLTVWGAKQYALSAKNKTKKEIIAIVASSGVGLCLGILLFGVIKGFSPVIKFGFLFAALYTLFGFITLMVWELEKH